MTSTATRLLAVAAWLAAAATLALPVMGSDARMNSVSANPANTVAADNPVNDLRLSSQSTDAASGRQPLSQVTFSDTGGANAAATATLTAGVEKQLDLRVTTKGFPGNNQLGSPVVTLTVTHPGYAGAFLNYPVRMSVWDGNGAGR